MNNKGKFNLKTNQGQNSDPNTIVLQSIIPTIEPAEDRITLNIVKILTILSIINNKLGNLTNEQYTIPSRITLYLMCQNMAHHTSDKHNKEKWINLSKSLQSGEEITFTDDQLSQLNTELKKASKIIAHKSNSLPTSELMKSANEVSTNALANLQEISNAQEQESGLSGEISESFNMIIYTVDSKVMEQLDSSNTDTPTKEDIIKYQNTLLAMLEKQEGSLDAENTAKKCLKYIFDIEKMTLNSTMTSNIENGSVNPDVLKEAREIGTELQDHVESVQSIEAARNQKPNSARDHIQSTGQMTETTL